jgi:hypothetical protein
MKMKERTLWHWAFGVVSAVLLTTVIIVSGADHVRAEQPMRVEESPEPPAQPALVPPSRTPEPMRDRGFEAELARLRAEIRRKDTVIATQMSAAALSAHILAARAERQVRAANALDERLFAGEDVDEHAAATLTREAESLVSRALDHTVEREVLCGPRICRIALRAAPDALRAAVESVVAHSGERLGTIRVFTLDQETALYLSDTAEALHIEALAGAEESVEQ